MAPDAPAIRQPMRCNRCAHYYITHDVHFKYGCRALDFKSRRQPILDVLEASAEPCLYFQAKSRSVSARPPVQSVDNR